ncbi:hypothetical protein NDN08_008284 [Rhodosorus marinus]|uniref:Uncharacterized protein n=1 Tax=Rhodosorus marinus TaxID=101924 RepID=A0AAV8UZY8_9RHOD|nr:hypothetical protein NDN08_008284 [Rhodosorus marinus]
MEGALVGFLGIGSIGVVGEGVSVRRRGRCVVEARAKNPGGFRLPPKVPEQKELLTRAYELLGNRAQRKLKPSAELELANLIGIVPENRYAAQKYKAAIELQLRKEFRVRNGTLIATPLSRTKYMDMITMPESERDINRSFSMLQALRREGDVAASTRAQLENLIGIVPRDAHEARRASNALKRLVRERYRTERYPPKMPETDEELTTAYMLISQYVREGTAGRRNSELEELLGALPRTENVAHYWKKFIGMHIRKNKRSALVNSRKAMAELIRQQRRERREAREAAVQAAEALEPFASNYLSASRMRLLVILAVAAASCATGITIRGSSSNLKVLP